MRKHTGGSSSLDSMDTGNKNRSSNPTAADTNLRSHRGLFDEDVVQAAPRISKTTGAVPSRDLFNYKTKPRSSNDDGRTTLHALRIVCI